MLQFGLTLSKLFVGFVNTIFYSSVIDYVKYRSGVELKMHIIISLYIFNASVQI